MWQKIDIKSANFGNFAEQKYRKSGVIDDLESATSVRGILLASEDYARAQHDKVKVYCK